MAAHVLLTLVWVSLDGAIVSTGPDGLSLGVHSVKSSSVNV